MRIDRVSAAVRSVLRSSGGELIVPVLLLAYATSYLLEVRSLPKPDVNLLLIRPVYVILLVCTLLFVAIKIASAFGRHRGNRPPAPDRSPTNAEPDDVGVAAGDFGKSIPFVFLTVAYVVAMAYVGFAVTTFIYMSVLSYLLGVRSKVLLTVVPAALIALIYFSMEKWLVLPLPKGLLF